jgi:hypothetical protein
MAMKFNETVSRHFILDRMKTGCVSPRHYKHVYTNDRGNAHPVFILFWLGCVHVSVMTVAMHIRFSFYFGWVVYTCL